MKSKHHRANPRYRHVLESLDPRISLSAALHSPTASTSPPIVQTVIPQDVQGPSSLTEADNLIPAFRVLDAPINNASLLYPVYLPPLEPEVPEVFPLDSQGWSILPKVRGRLDIYVSSSTGSDTNTGLSEQTPVKTIAKAESLVRDGYADRVLLKSGDKWYESVRWGRSGKSADKPMLITSYGEGARPRILSGYETGFNMVGKLNEPIYLALVGLEFKAEKRVASKSNLDLEPDPFGIRIIGPGTILIEDTVVSNYKDNVVITGNEDPAYPTTLLFRRNIVTDSWSANGHSQGLYVSKINRGLIEESVFDHNGWNEDIPQAQRTIFNHNIYIQSSSTPVVVRNNISTRASSHGLQQRSGGLTDNNLFLRNAIATFTGGDSAIVRSNVVLESDDISDTLPRGRGIEVIRTARGLIEHNLVLNRLSKSNVAGIRTEPDIDTTNPQILIRANIVRNWINNDGNGIDLRSPDYMTQSNISNRKLEGGPRITFNDPTASLYTYLSSLGTSNSFDFFIKRVTDRPGGTWQPQFTADAVNDYLRQAYNPILPA